MKHTKDNLLEIKGTVQRFLMSPKGDVDGFLLDDGTQVNFPPHMSQHLTAVIAPNDKVDVRGFRENAKVVKAETITNTKTSKSVASALSEKGPEHGPKHLEGLQKLSAHGEIQAQIFGHHGEVNGVVLSDGSIVRFGPHISGSTNVKIEIGQSLQASGPGTKNSYGQALEATELSNK